MTFMRINVLFSLYQKHMQEFRIENMVNLGSKIEMVRIVAYWLFSTE